MQCLDLVCLVVGVSCVTKKKLEELSLTRKVSTMQAHCEGCGALLLRVDHRGRCWYCGTPSPDVQHYPVEPDLAFTMSCASSQWQRGIVTVLPEWGNSIEREQHEQA